MSYFSFCWCCVSSTNTEALCWFFLNSSSLCAELIYTLCDVKMIAAPGILRCTDESSEQVVLTLFFDNLLQCLPRVNFKVTALQHSEGLSRCVSPVLFLSFNQLAPDRFIGLSSSSFSPLSHPLISQPCLPYQPTFVRLSYSSCPWCIFFLPFGVLFLLATLTDHLSWYTSSASG